MNTLPPRINEAARDHDTKTLTGLAVGLTAGLAATGSAVVGAMAGTALVCYAASRSARTREQRWSYILRHMLLIAAVAALMFLGHGIVSNWADFKQGFVEGWNAV